MSRSTTLLGSKLEFQTALRHWFRQNARPLPWREQPSLYKTVVSEFMLQQTQVKTALPYFERWIRELPDFSALARASEDRVLKLWEGLGYYSRARNLHRLAQAIVKLPSAPRAANAWLDLPGVGPYTAAAITSISFGAPAACVDGNVVRILARLTAEKTQFRDSASAAKVFASLAFELLPASNPGDHNQAMMELGATVCFRTKPLCLTCPVRSFCSAARAGNPEDYPRLAPKVIEQRTIIRAWCERNGALLLHRASENARRFALIHELPLAEQVGFTPPSDRSIRPLLERRRSITRYQIRELIYSVPSTEGRLPADLVWTPFSEIETVTLSGPHRRWINEILASRQNDAGSPS